MAQRACGPSSSSRMPAQQVTVESLCQGLLDDVMMVDDDKYRALCGAFGGFLQEWPDLSGVCYTGFGAPPSGEAVARETSNGNNSCSGSGSGSSGDGSRKRKSDAYAYLGAKGDCKRPRGKQQLCELDEAAGAGKGKPERPKAGTKKKAELALSKDPRAAAAATAGQMTDYIHVRARRGQATDSHSLAERVRRERISERMRYLQELVPGCNKVTGKAGMLDEIINYVQSLQKQVEFLSMKIAASNPVVNFNILEDLFGRQLNQQMTTTLPIIGQQLEQSCLQMSTMQQMQAAAAGFPAGFGLDMVVNNQYPPPRSGPTTSAATPVSAGAPVESCLDVNGAAAWDIGSQNMFSGFDAQFQSVQSECLLDNLKMEM